MSVLIPQSSIYNDDDPQIANSDLNVEQNEINELGTSNSLQTNLKESKHHSKHRNNHRKSDTISDANQIISDYVKIENRKSSLKREAKLYKMLSGAPGFPIYQHFNTKGEAGELFLEALGPNLMSLIKGNIKMDNGNKSYFTLKTVLQIADQALLRLQYFHKRGYIHGDVNPENLSIGKSHKSNQIYLTNMSLAARYINKKDGEHLPFSDKHNYQGSLSFSSINSQRGLKLSRRDDLESLGYVLVYLLNGSLPWSSYTSNKSVLFSKMNTPVKYLCDGLPSEFEQFINSARCLSYSDDPDYSYYRQLFRNLFISRGYIYDYLYDWSINDHFKTIICMSESFSQTIPHCAPNSLKIQHNKEFKPHSKSNGNFYNSLGHLSAHQTADIAMLNCNHRNKHRNNKRDQKNQIAKEKIIPPPLDKEFNFQSNTQHNSLIAASNLQNNIVNRSRLLMNIRGTSKKTLRNQSSG